MTLKEKINEAAEEYAQKMISEANTCCEQCHHTALDCFRDSGCYGPRAFTAGASFMLQMLKAEQAKVATLREALEWYAENAYYNQDTMAREALAEVEK